MKILGISSYYHDSAAALVCDGIIKAAVQEERLTRIKHDPAFPKNAIAYCLEKENLSLDELDYIAFYEKPFLKFERLLENYLAFAPKGFLSFKKAMPLWIKEKLFQKDLIYKELKILNNGTALKNKLLFSEHHMSHAASAFYPSPFNRALVLTLDGVGEWATTTAAIGNGNKLEIFKEITYPHSLGLLYSAFTYYTGFKVNSGEYKLMGLAPYGSPLYVNKILDHLIDVKEDGSFRLNMDYFNYCTGLTMTNAKFNALFDGPVRTPEEPITQKHMDIAASIQVALETILLKMVTSLQKETGEENLCLAGGVALNCVANGKILKENIFKNIWIQPASGDSGGAIGAALNAYYRLLQLPRKINSRALDSMQGSYLGPSFSQSEIEKRLTKIGAHFHTLDEKGILEKTAESLVKECAVGWFQGSMEFGPRALGNRSIIADPRSSKMQSTLNLKIKYRESFRPFAPAVLIEDVDTWFEMKGKSPYMLLVADVVKDKRYKLTPEQKKLFGIEKLNIPRSPIPAVTHVDYSARIQTVHPETNLKFYNLLKKFKEKTGCGVLVNTSFNVRGEPIVCTPEDAFRCFMGTELDILVVGNSFLIKEEQNKDLILDYKNSFDLD